VKQASKNVNYISLNKACPTPVALINEDYTMLVHSGGAKDVAVLCELIQKTAPTAELPVYVFTQVHVEFDDPRFHFRNKEYPVAQYFKHAKHIYTAAGFNLMQELQAYRHKHTVFPIDRLYDDQWFRAKTYAEKD